jgi:hypothetical protein
MGLCRRIYPNQLTGIKIGKMKALLFDDRFRYWPINSIAILNNRVSESGSAKILLESIRQAYEEFGTAYILLQ